MAIKDYDRPSLTTDIVLFKVEFEKSEDKRKSNKPILKVLLVRRFNEPFKGQLSLPGGFVDIDETIEDNVRRKLKDKTGVVGDFYIEQLYTKGDLDRDPRGRVVSVSYLGLGNEETIEYIKEEKNVEWYEVERILNGGYGEISFDHIEIIGYALERFKNKIEYTDIAFNLLGKEFTILDIQQIYEKILGKDILNFRRKIKDYVVPLNKKTDGKQYRPAELFTLNNDRENKF